VFRAVKDSQEEEEEVVFRAVKDSQEEEVVVVFRAVKEEEQEEDHFELALPLALLPFEPSFDDDVLQVVDCP
jgi:hypothetical protein